MARYYEKNDYEGIVVGIAIVVAIMICVVSVFFAFLISPGLLLVSLVSGLLGLSFDAGQVWVFSIIASLIIFGLIFYRINRSIAKNGSDAPYVFRFVKLAIPLQPSRALALKVTAIYYALLSFGIVVAGAILLHGFHVEFIRNILSSLGIKS